MRTMMVLLFKLLLFIIHIHKKKIIEKSSPWIVVDKEDLEETSFKEWHLIEIEEKND